MTVAPRVETERLVLRELRKSDFSAYADHMADTVATTFLGGTIDRRRAWSTFAALTGAWTITGAGWWAVEARNTGDFVGWVGAFYREGCVEEGWAPTQIELGWSILRAHWRRGFATEAARGALAFAFERHGAERVIAHVHPDNVASARVAQAIGMAYEGLTTFYGSESALYAIRRVAAS